MRHGSVLRFDHIMGLHRMYFIPDGFPMDQGTYVEYPAEELYAVLSMESHRHQTMLIGGDLGTVPPYVPKAMKNHGIGNMFVDQFALRNTARQLPVPDVGSLASVGTHDTPPFARWWRGVDIEDRQALGLIDPARSDKARHIRQGAISRVGSWTGADGPAPVHQALIDSLGASSAALVLANLEDLWLEEEPQTVPGTSQDLPNWPRQSALGLEEIRSSDEVRSALLRLTRSRREAAE